MSHPGVIIKQVANIAVAVQKSPTVPLIIVQIADAVTGNTLPWARGCIKIDDALALREFSPNAIWMKVTISDLGVVSINANMTFGALVLNHYFENGGGPCYFLSLGSGNDGGYADRIREHPDISLIATGLQGTNYPNQAVDQIAPLLQEKKGIFFIACGGAGTVEYTYVKVKDQTATYFPFLDITTAPPWRDDAHIEVDWNGTLTTMAQLKGQDPALYAQADALVKTQLDSVRTVRCQPGAAIAAAICRADRERGVWKAPANMVIKNAEPSSRLSNADDTRLTGKGINAIRYINGQLLINGARTCDFTSEDWRYISVRRLFNKVQRDVGDALESFMFEPNAPYTWQRARSAIETYLHGIWQLGGLKGDRPEQGYLVEVGKDVTMADDDIAAGKMIVKISLAPVRPVEFIILQFSQDMR